MLRLGLVREKRLMGRRGLLGLVRGNILADFQWCTVKTSFDSIGLAVFPA